MIRQTTMQEGPAESKTMEIQEFYVTVGVQYGNRENAPQHPLGLHSDGYTVIEAPNEEIARGIAFAIAGEKFSFLYDRARFIEDGTAEKHHPLGEELRIAWQTPEQVRDIMEHLERITDGLPSPVGRFRLSDRDRDPMLETEHGERTEFAKGLQRRQEEIRDRFAEMGSPQAIADKREAELAAEEDEPFIWDSLSSTWKLAEHAHVHSPTGTCIKNRFGPLCTPIVRSTDEEKN